MRSNNTNSNTLVSVFGFTVVGGKTVVEFVSVLRLALHHVHAHLERLAAARLALQPALIAIPSTSDLKRQCMAGWRRSRCSSRSDSLASYRQS